MSTSIRLDRVLQPLRPELDRCLGLIQEHESVLAVAIAKNADTLTRCEQRIADISNQVLAQGTGCVPAELIEREQALRLQMTATRRQLEAACRQLWARLLSDTRRFWRKGAAGGSSTSPPSLDVAIALASDPAGIEASESAALSLADAGAPWGIHLGRRVCWRVGSELCFSFSLLGTFAPLLRALDASLHQAGLAHDVFQRAYRRRAWFRRLPRPRGTAPIDAALRPLGDAMFLDAVFTAAVQHELRVLGDSPPAGTRFAELPNPAQLVLAIWETGYGLCDASETELVLQAYWPPRTAEKEAVDSAHWQRLADCSVPLSYRLGEVSYLCATCDEVSLDLFCTQFLDEVIASGRINDALNRASMAALRSLGSRIAPLRRPDNGGVHAVGPLKLYSEPGGVRDAIGPVLDALGRRSSQNPELMRWLFEALKLYTHERSKALSVLAKARVEHRVLYAGMSSLVDFTALKHEQIGCIVVDAASAWLRRPDWLLPLISTLAKSPAAADHVADQIYADRFEFCHSPGITRVKWRRRLMHLAASAPSGARALALLALANLAVEPPELESLVSAALTDAQARPGLLIAAAQVARLRGIFTRAVLNAARELAAQPPTNYQRTQLVQQLDALLAAARLHSPPAPVLLRGQRLLVWAGELGVGGLGALADVGIAVVLRPLSAEPSSAWCSTHDELGAIAVYNDRAFRSIAPISFPGRETGASAARRTVTFAADHEGNVVLIVESPFRNRSRWGEVHYALGWRPGTSAWCAYRNDQGMLVLDRWLTRPIEEAELPVVEVQIDDAIAAARQSRQEARQRWPWQATSTRSLSGREQSSPWTLHAAEGTPVEVGGVIEELRELWPAARTAAQLDIRYAIGWRNTLFLAVRAIFGPRNVEYEDAVVRVLWPR